MGLKGKIEAIIYAAEEPINLDHIAYLMKEQVLQELAAEQERAAAEALENAAVEAAQRQLDPDDTAAAATAVETAAVEPSQAPAETRTKESSGADETANQTDGGEVNHVTTLDDTVVPTAPEPSAEASSTEPATPEAPEPPASEASENAKPVVSPRRKKNEVPAEVRTRVRALVEELISDYANNDRGMEVRLIAGGYRMTTKPEHHDIVKAFAKSLKPPLRLSLPALETLAVVAYKQPVTAPEVSDIRGVESQGVMATLLERKLITTAGRKAVIGRPILYKTTKEFLLRFGLNNTSELPSIEEFEKLAQEQNGLFISEGESEPTLTSEEASARLEQASAEAEVDSEGPSESTSETAEQHSDETAAAGASAAETEDTPGVPEETHQN